MVTAEQYRLPTDPDDRCVQRAIDQSPPGSVVELDTERVYTVPKQVTVWGGRQVVGHDSQVHVAAGGFGVFALTGAHPGLQDVHTFGGTIGVEIKGGATDPQLLGGSGNHAGQAVAINAPGVRRPLLDGFDFYDCGFGLLTNSRAVDLEDLVVQNFTADRLTADAVELNHPDPTSAETGARNVLIRNFDVRARPAGSTDPGAPSSGFGIGVAHCHGVRIEDGIAEGRTEAVHLEDSTTDVAVRRVLMRNSPVGLWALGVSGLVLDDDQIQDCRRGVFLTFDAKRWVEHVAISATRFERVPIPIEHRSNHPLYLTVAAECSYTDCGPERVVVYPTATEVSITYPPDPVVHVEEPSMITVEAKGAPTDTPAIQAAIAANPGREVRVVGKDVTLTSTLVISSSRTQLVCEPRMVAGFGGPMVRVLNARRNRVRGFFDGNWQANSTAVEIVGGLLGEYDIEGDRLMCGVLLDSERTEAKQNSALNRLRVSLDNARVGVAFQGKHGQYASNNWVERLEFWAAGSGSIAALSFRRYCDNNVVEGGYVYLQKPGQVGVIMGQPDDADVEVYENHLGTVRPLIIEANQPGAIAVQGHRTWGRKGDWPTTARLRLSGGATPQLAIADCCDLDLTGSNFNPGVSSPAA